MSDEINVNKISDKQKRKADHLKDDLERKGMGRDEAEKRALEAVSEELNSSGGNTAGDPKKGAHYENKSRRGSDKEAG